MNNLRCNEDHEHNILYTVLAQAKHARYLNLSIESPSCKPLLGSLYRQPARPCGLEGAASGVFESMSRDYTPRRCHCVRSFQFLAAGCRKTHSAIAIPASLRNSQTLSARIYHTRCSQMAPRPAKRQRRSTIVLSDESDADLDLSSKPTKTSLQREITLDGRTSTNVSPAKTPTTRVARASSKKTPGKASPASSPEKTRKNVKSKPEPVNNRSLHNFFGKATDEQRWRKKSQTPDVEVENTGELSDAIEDDDLSDETLQELGLKTGKTNTLLDKQQPGALPATRGLKSSSNGGSLPSSQRFVKPTALIHNASKPESPELSEVEGGRPWADRYGPTNLEELVVHKKKVSDVQNWLQGTRDGRHNQKLLVLKGPAGSGKTTTVSLLAKSMGMQLVAWHNPAVSELGANNSMSAQFDEFLNRGGHFDSLAFDQNIRTGTFLEQNAKDQVLVVEEFPATITRSSTALQSFRSVISRFLAQARARPTISLRGQQGADDKSRPMVMIISETLLSSSTALSDSFTAHRLLGPEILNHPMVTAMDFNPVAPTFVVKALDLVVKKEARDSGRRRTPGPGVIAKLAEIGDVRSAVNSLEFLCLRRGDGSEWSGTVAAKVKRSSKDNLALTETEKNSLALVSQRETTLDMFHAAGKVVYNKREDPRASDTRAQPPPKPPDHLMHLYTPKVSQVDIEALLNETGTDIQTFISTLHENYVLSCNGDSFEMNFDGCSDILSASDVLNPENRPTRRGHTSNPNLGVIQSSLQAGSSDTLRQDEISFHVASRGLLFNLPFPVNRAAVSLPGGKKQDVYKMFYPASLRLWKPIEEMQGLLDTFTKGDRAMIGRASLDGPSDSHGGVSTWRSRSFAAEIGTSTAPVPIIKQEPSESFALYPTLPRLEDEDTTPPRSVIYGKDVLVLELLPYMTRILSIKRQDTSTLEQITKFKPTSYLTTEEEFEEEDNLNPPSHPGIGSAKLFDPATVTGRRATSKPETNLPETDVEKLYISDDDIEDD